jgi:hypothetical protein
MARRAGVRSGECYDHGQAVAAITLAVRSGRLRPILNLNSRRGEPESTSVCEQALRRRACEFVRRCVARTLRASSNSYTSGMRLGCSDRRCRRRGCREYFTNAGLLPYAAMSRSCRRGDRAVAACHSSSTRRVSAGSVAAGFPVAACGSAGRNADDGSVGLRAGASHHNCAATGEPARAIVFLSRRAGPCRARSGARSDDPSPPHRICPSFLHQPACGSRAGAQARARSTQALIAQNVTGIRLRTCPHRTIVGHPVTGSRGSRTFTWRQPHLQHGSSCRGDALLLTRHQPIGC